MVELQAKAILPDTVGIARKNDRFLKYLLDVAVNRVAGVVMDEFKLTTRTWTKKPKFLKKTNRKDGNYSVLVYTEDTIYGYVTLGTVAHKIVAKNAPFLRFQPESRPKTTPRILNPSKGFVGGSFVMAKEVNHPGTEAREFHIIIRDRAQTRLDLDIRNAMKVWKQTK